MVATARGAAATPSTVALGPRDPDLHSLEQFLRILADPSRLQLLLLLRRPRTIEEIRLPAHRQVAGQRPVRPMTRQAIRNHIHQLTESGLVRVRLARREGRRSLQEFIIDRARLFGIVEDLRVIGTLEPATDVDPSETMELSHEPSVEGKRGARVVHVNGPYAGQSVALGELGTAKGRGWIVGRGPSCQVRIDYDPYVSKEQAEILRGRSGFSLIDLRSSRNETRLNWTSLQKGEEALLRGGDIVQVGRSLMVFREE